MFNKTAVVINKRGVGKSVSSSAPGSPHLRSRGRVADKIHDAGADQILYVRYVVFFKGSRRVMIADR